MKANSSGSSETVLN